MGKKTVSPNAKKVADPVNTYNAFHLLNVSDEDEDACDKRCDEKVATVKHQITNDQSIEGCQKQPSDKRWNGDREADMWSTTNRQDKRRNGGREADNLEADNREADNRESNNRESNNRESNNRQDNRWNGRQESNNRQDNRWNGGRESNNRESTNRQDKRWTGDRESNNRQDNRWNGSRESNNRESNNRQDNRWTGDRETGDSNSFGSRSSNNWNGQPPGNLLSKDPRDQENDKSNNHEMDDGFRSAVQKKKYNRDAYNERSSERVEDFTNCNLLEYYDSEKEMPGDSMKLNSKWTIWIHDNEDTDWSVGSYRAIYEIDSVGKMWRFLNVFDNLNKTVRQYYIMREGITPIWEDNNNKEGGICSIMMENNRNVSNLSGNICVDTFISILCLVMNETFVINNMDINGLCYSVKQKYALIKLWVKNFSTNKNFIDKLPISLLNTVSNILDNGQRSSKLNRSKISVQIKQIVPSY